MNFLLLVRAGIPDLIDNRGPVMMTKSQLSTGKKEL